MSKMLSVDMGFGDHQVCFRMVIRAIQPGQKATECRILENNMEKRWKCSQYVEVFKCQNLDFIDDKEN